ncbi:MAG: hypothetical protein DMF67_15670 [Acidobacteria bacterium]|nr:MAG: hypothetical protein DMF67_15670 [Acidobacteriota bacterium]
MLSVLLVWTTLAFSDAISLFCVTGAMTAISLTIAVCGSAFAGFGSSFGLASSCVCIGAGATSVRSSRLGSGIESLYQ